MLACWTYYGSVWRGAGMNAFVDKYEDRIHGVLSCFDRMLFRGCVRAHDPKKASAKVGRCFSAPGYPRAAPDAVVRRLNKMSQRS